jgi:hypothetical protein
VGAVREGARYASILPNPSANVGAIKGVVKNYYSSIDTSKVQVLDSSAVNGRITVRVQDHPFAFITPLVNVVVSDTLYMTRAATFRWERTSQ